MSFTSAALFNRWLTILFVSQRFNEGHTAYYAAYVEQLVAKIDATGSVKKRVYERDYAREVAVLGNVFQYLLFGRVSILRYGSAETPRLFR